MKFREWRVAKKIMASVLSLAMITGMLPASVFAQKDAGDGAVFEEVSEDTSVFVSGENEADVDGDAEFTLTEFHMTDSNWIMDPDSGYVTEIDRHPSFSIEWTTTGLEAPGDNEWYDAELFVYPHSKSNLNSSLSSLASMNSWPDDDPRRTRIEGLGNNYWQKSIPKTSMTKSGGKFTGMLAGNFMDLSNAAINDGSTCTWQLLIYKRTKVSDDETNTEVVYQTDFTETKPDWYAGLPFMNEKHMEISYTWGEDDALVATDDVSYEAEIYVWPQDGLQDPYSFPYGWVAPARWSTVQDFNVLMSQGAWADCLLEKGDVSAWFCNDSEMQADLGEGNSLTPVPGATYTTGMVINKIDRSSGSAVVTPGYRYSPVVEFTVSEGTDPGEGLAPGETSGSTSVMPDSGTDEWKKAIAPKVDSVEILEYPEGGTGELKMGVTFHFPNLTSGFGIEDVPGFNGMSVVIKAAHESEGSEKTARLRPGESRVTSSPSEGIDSISYYWDWAYLSDGKCYTIKTIDLIGEETPVYSDEDAVVNGACTGDLIKVSMTANGIIRDEGGNVDSYASPESASVRFTVSDSIKDETYTKAYLDDPEDVYVSLGTYQDDERTFNLNIDPDNPKLQELTGGKWAVAVVQMTKYANLNYHIFPMKEDMLKVASGTTGYVTYATDKYNRQNWQWCNSKGVVLNPDNPWAGYDGSSAIDASMGHINVSVYQFTDVTKTDENAHFGYYDDEDMYIGIQAVSKEDRNLTSGLVVVRIPLSSDSLSKTFRPIGISTGEDPHTDPTDNVTQPSIGYSARSINSDSITDLSISKTDGSFTFDSLMNGEVALVKDTDYTVAKGSVTIKEEYLATLDGDSHTFTFHYTGVAGKDDTTPVDPTFTLTIVKVCTPVVTVSGNNGIAVTDDCEINWYKDSGRYTKATFPVTSGTKLYYTVTPGDTLKTDNVQYYKAVQGDATISKDGQIVNVKLGRQGSVTLNPVLKNGEKLQNTDEGYYTVRWSVKKKAEAEVDGMGEADADGAASAPVDPTPEDDPMNSGLYDTGTVLSYTVRMYGTYKEDYPDIEDGEVTVGFGNKTEDVTVGVRNNITLSVSGNKADGSEITDDDVIVSWYVKSDKTGEFVGAGTGSTLKNIQLDTGTKLYYEIAPRDRYISGKYVCNWLQFHGVPLTFSPEKGSAVCAVSENTVTVTDEPQKLTAQLLPVREVTLTGKVNNGKTIGADSLVISMTQTPWAQFKSTPYNSYYYSSQLSKDITEKKPGEGNSLEYTAKVYDFDADVRIRDERRNFDGAYAGAVYTGSDEMSAQSVTLAPGEIPSYFDLYVKRVAPWKGEVRYNGIVEGENEYNAFEYEESAYFEFSLYNVTKDKAVPESDYDVEYNGARSRVLLDTEAIAQSGSIEMGDELKLTMTVPKEKQANLHAYLDGAFSDTVVVKKNMSNADYENKRHYFNIRYYGWGRIGFWLPYTYDWRGYNDKLYALYSVSENGTDTVLVGSGKAYGGRQDYEVKAGKYILCQTRETQWLHSLPSTYEELKMVLNEDEYVSAPIELEKEKSEYIDFAELGAPVPKDRVLFKEGGGFDLDMYNPSLTEPTQVRLEYAVDDSVARANPDGLYAIRVNLHDGSSPIALKRDKYHDFQNPEMHDSCINLYANGKLDTKNTVEFDYSGGFYSIYAQDPRSFIMYTTQPSGVIYFYVYGALAGEYAINADGWMCISNTNRSYRDAKNRGGIDSTVFKVDSVANCSLYFASDYLRLPDNGNGLRYSWYGNALWAYGLPGKNIDLYMDDVKIGSVKCSSQGLAYFGFQMDETFKDYNHFPEDWSRTGKHTIYAVMDIGNGEEVRSQTYERECLAAVDEVRPAVLTGLTVQSVGTDRGNTDVTRLFTFNSQNSGKVSYSYTMLNGVDRRYEFTATVENADWVDGDLILWLTSGLNMTRSVDLKRDGDTNVFKGFLEQDDFVFSQWEVTITSKRPSKTGVAFEGNDEVSRAEATILDVVDPSEKVLNPMTGEVQTVSEYKKFVNDFVDEVSVSANDLIDMVRWGVNADINESEGFFKDIAEMTGYELPSDLKFDGSDESVALLRSYLGMNVLYPLAIDDEKDDDAVKEMKSQLSDWKSWTDGVQTVMLDGSVQHGFSRLYVQENEDDHKPHLYYMDITVVSDNPECEIETAEGETKKVKIDDYAIVNVIDYGESELPLDEFGGKDLLSLLASLEAEDIMGSHEGGLDSAYSEAELNGGWDLEPRSFTEKAIFGKSLNDRIGAAADSMRKNNQKNPNANNVHNQYWDIMRNQKREQDISGAGAGTKEAGNLQALNSYLGEMIDQGEKSGNLTPAELKELKEYQKMVREVSDVTSSDAAYELARKEYEFYKQAAEAGKMVSGAGAAESLTDYGLNQLKDYAKGTMEDAMKDNAYDNASSAKKYNPGYWAGKAGAWLASKLSGDDMIEYEYDALMDELHGNAVKLSTDPERYLKERADEKMRQKIEEAKKKINTVLRGLEKYGITSNVKSSSTGRHTNNGRSRAHIDPEGIIYEAVLSNPVADATATLYEKTEAHPEGEIWDAEEWGQENNQITVENGHYQWFVPEGEWQVRVTHPEDRPDLSDNTSADHPNANLEDGSTKGWLPVLPVQMGINIPLTSSAAPTVSGASIYKKYAQVQLSLYTDTSYLTSDTVTVTSGGKTVSCNIALPDQDVDPTDESRYLARTIRLIPADGQGFAENTEYTISIADGVVAYNGKTMGAYEEQLEIKAGQSGEPEPEDVEVIAPIPLSLGYKTVSQNLVIPGSAAKGSMEYAMDDGSGFAPEDGAFGTSIPKGKDAGEYKVWYRVVDDKGALIAGPSSVKAIIKKAANPAAIKSEASVVIGAKSFDLSGNVTNAAGEVTYTISGDAAGCSISGSQFWPGDKAAEVSVSVNVAGDKNYNSKTGVITVSVIEKKDDSSSSEDSGSSSSSSSSSAKDDSSSSGAGNDSSSSAKDDSSSSAKDDGSSSAKDESSSSGKPSETSSTAVKKKSAADFVKMGAEGYAGAEDTLPLTTAKKAAALTIPEGVDKAVITVVSGTKLYLTAAGGSGFTSSQPKMVKINKKGMVKINKKYEGKADITFDRGGKTCTLTLDCIKLTAGVSGNSAPAGSLNVPLNAAAGTKTVINIKAPLSAKFDLASKKYKNKGVLDSVTVAIGDDALWHVTATVQTKGNVTIPIEINGKVYKCKIKVKTAG